MTFPIFYALKVDQKNFVYDSILVPKMEMEVAFHGRGCRFSNIFGKIKKIETMKILKFFLERTNFWDQIRGSKNDSKNDDQNKSF